MVTLTTAPEKKTPSSDGNDTQDIRSMNEKMCLRVLGARCRRLLFWHYIFYRTRSLSELQIAFCSAQSMKWLIKMRKDGSNNNVFIIVIIWNSINTWVYLIEWLLLDAQMCCGISAASGALTAQWQKKNSRRKNRLHELMSLSFSRMMKTRQKKILIE